MDVPRQDAEAAAAAAEQRCSELRATQAAVQLDVDMLGDARVQAHSLLRPRSASKMMCSVFCLLCELLFSILPSWQFSFECLACVR